MRRSIIVVKMPLLIFVVVFQARMSLAGDTPAPQPGAATFFGEVRPMGNGMAWSWVRHDAKRHPDGARYHLH